MNDLRKIPATAVLLFFGLAALAGCADAKKAPIPTGVIVNDIGGGRREFVATARASDAAIAKKAPSMMMSTSMRAARLLMQNELQKPEYAGKGSYQEGEGEFLEDGEYCRLRGIFTPGK